MIKTTSEEEVMEGRNTIVVTRVEDFNDKQDKEFWKDVGNQSSAREGIFCRECHYPIVMSNNMFKAYSKKPMPELVLCGRCFIKEFY